MARKSTPKKPTSADADVETYVHPTAKRKNIPTAENQKLVADEDKAIKKLRWPRNPDLDPQLVWRGKDFEPDPLEVDAPPIYIQEKIQPRAIIEELRRQTKERRPDGTPQFDFFHDFNGLPEGWKEDATASYYHDEGNWSNRMILGDSLLVMASLADREALRGKVQCIYMDPPYGIRFNSNWQPSTKSRDVKEGKIEGVSREPEVIRAFRDTWKDEIHSYLSYLRDRLVVVRDLLHESGSVFVQIGDENVHLVRGILDEVFGPKNFCAQITVAKTASASSELLAGVCDYILWFSIKMASVKYRQIYLSKEIGGQGGGQYNRVQLPDGSRRSIDKSELATPALLPDGSRVFRIDNMTSQRPPGDFPVSIVGRTIRPLRGYWKTGEKGMARLQIAARLELVGNTLSYVRFIDDFRVFPTNNIGQTLVQVALATRSCMWCKPHRRLLSAAY